jgi:hypothetical protein
MGSEGVAPYPLRSDEAEKSEARQKFGFTKQCPNCNATKNIDNEFGWRRMHPSDDEVVPQSYCIDCRSK